MSETPPDRPPMQVLAEAVQHTSHQAGAEAGRRAARAAITKRAWRTVLVGVGVWLLLQAALSAYIYHVAEDAGATAARNEFRQNAADAQRQATDDEIKALRSQVAAINAKRKAAGLPPVKKVAPDIAHDAPGSASTKENAELVARLAAALVPAPKNGARGKTGPAGVSVTSVHIVRCTLTLATSDGHSYAGNVCGPPGKDGPQGIQGIPGKDGASAYAVWLAAGHVGSVADFIASLRGPAGRGVVAVGTTGKDAGGCQRLTIQYTGEAAATAIGDPICDGQSGPAGKDGADGKDGTPGRDGNPATRETYTLPDGTVRSCVRDTESTDTAPSYTCSDSPPGGSVITPDGSNGNG